MLVEIKDYTSRNEKILRPKKMFLDFKIISH